MRTSHSVVIRRSVLALLLCLTFRAPAMAQDSPSSTPRGLSGPRFGLTYLSDAIVDKLQDEGIDVSPVISQFGWQFEKQFTTGESGPMLVTEWVLLAGGAEQGLFLPSVSWLTGLRTRKGIEVGIGPNVSAAGVALVGAMGMTFKAGDVNFPVTLAVVPSAVTNWEYSGPPAFRAAEVEKRAVRVSLLFGFHTRR